MCLHLLPHVRAGEGSQLDVWALPQLPACHRRPAGTCPVMSTRTRGTESQTPPQTQPSRGPAWVRARGSGGPPAGMGVQAVRLQLGMENLEEKRDDHFL